MVKMTQIEHYKREKSFEKKIRLNIVNGIKECNEKIRRWTALLDLLDGELAINSEEMLGHRIDIGVVKSDSECRTKILRAIFKGEIKI